MLSTWVGGAGRTSLRYVRSNLSHAPGRFWIVALAELAAPCSAVPRMACRDVAPSLRYVRSNLSHAPGMA